MNAAHDDAVAVLSGWQAPDDGQGQLQAAYLSHLDQHRDGHLRSCHPDHLTASVLVVSEDRDRVLLNLHRRYERWVQFGGHIDEDDARLLDAATREAVEESGLDDLRLLGDVPTQLSVHEVRCGPLRPAHHLDVRYVAVAAASASTVVSAESLDVRWFTVEALPTGLDAALVELIATVRRR